MFLVMFDVDGTLVIGNVIDDVCFSQAIKEVLGVSQIDTDWSHYSNVTDSGITSEIIKKHLFKRATEDDINSVRRSYLSRLQDEIGRNPNSFRATLGAKELITALLSEDDVFVSMATGSWHDSALLKLRTVGFLFDNIPIASSDDAHKRESILRKSYDFAIANAGCEEFQSVLYIGDHPRDYVNSRKLGYDFIGIGSGNQAERLRHAGAKQVKPDFAERDYFLKILDIARQTEMR